MSRKTIARYSVNFGLEGCYMPDSYDGVHEFHTRRELADFIRSELDMYDMPKKLFTEVGIIKLWQFIKRNGPSTAHFTLYHKGYALRFNGLTEGEYNSEIQQEEA